MIAQNAELLKRMPKWLYKSAAQLFIDKSFPRHLFIETNKSCNLSCSYCPRERGNGNMDFELFQRIIDEASQFGPRSFSFHLFGEPFLYPRIFDAFNYARQKNRGNTLLVTSNGTMFNQYVDDIVRCPIDKLIWSWRPEAKFTEETKKKFEKWGKLTVRIIEAVVPTSAKEEWRTWKNVEIRSLHNYGGQIDLLKFGAQNTVSQRWPCYHLFLAPAVSWQGNFLMCCADPHQKEIVGDIRKQSIAELWQKMNGIREAHLRGDYSGICTNCDVWKNYPDLHFKWQKH